MVAEERRTMTQTRKVMVQMSVQIEESPIPLQLILAVEGVQEMQHQQYVVRPVARYLIVARKVIFLCLRRTHLASHPFLVILCHRHLDTQGKLNITHVR